MAKLLDRITDVLNRDLRSNATFAASGDKQALRILLIFFMTFVLLFMAACPALLAESGVKSQRHYRAAQRNHESEQTVGTQRELEVAALEVEEAKRFARRNVRGFEIFWLAVLGVAVYAFIRVGRGARTVSETQ